MSLCVTVIVYNYTVGVAEVVDGRLCVTVQCGYRTVSVWYPCLDRVRLSWCDVCLCEVWETPSPCHKSTGE